MSTTQTTQTDTLMESTSLPGKALLLHTQLQALGSVLVAYSGGTDSAFLAWAAHRALGDRMLAVIADSASLPRAELAAALAFTREHGIPTHILHTDELSNPDYIRNDAQRCFHCKDELFTQMEAARAQLGFAHLAYGMNLDDRGEFRPGDKPASACLSSRLEYGRPVTPENLLQVEQAEAALHALGFPQVRVRHHGDLARIEIAREDLPRAFSLTILDRVSTEVRKAGFLYVTMDTQGYRSGSMNDVLPVSAIAPAGR